MEFSSKFWLFMLFGAVVLYLLYFDLKKTTEKTLTPKTAALWSLLWISLALLFNVVIFFVLGKETAVAFLAGYLIEKSLSVDNIFVFIMIFGYFKIERRYQTRVLIWGILGALFMRAIFIFAGIEILKMFSWAIYIFGAILIYTGIKMMVKKETEIHIEQNIAYRILKKLMPLTPKMVNEHFFIKEQGKYLATPLFVALVIIETSDLIFAFDSIPAILAITTDPFTVYTSNIFAILGLRALFSLLAGIVEIFRYLKEGVSVILIFVGIKMTIAEFYHISTSHSLIFISIIIALSIFASIMHKKKDIME